MEMDMDGSDGEGGDLFSGLPEGFIANTLSMTSPRDAGRLSLVASIFRAASEWDVVWERFLPPDYQDIISQAVDRDTFGFTTKKQLYLHLCENPVLIDGGNKSFSLDKSSGKKCYMLAARDLSIVWGDTPRYWRWTSLPESRFAEVAELVSVCWLEMRAKISTTLLSPNTTYAAYFVFKFTAVAYGFEYQAAEVSIGTGLDETKTKMVYLDPQGGQNQRNPVVSRRFELFGYRGLVRPQIARGPTKVDGVFPTKRADGWLEIEVGEYLNKDGDGGELHMSITEVKGGNWKGGLIIEGIEIRPRIGKQVK